MSVPGLRLRLAPAAALMVVLPACSTDETFYRVPLTEIPERSFIVEFEGEEVVAVEVDDGSPLRRVEPTERPLYWVSLPEATLNARLAATPTATLVLRFVLAPVGCAEDFEIAEEREGTPVRRLEARYARLDPGEAAFVPLLEEDVDPSSPLGRLSLVVDAPRSCQPPSALEYRKIELGLAAPARLGDLHPLGDGRIVGPDDSMRVLHLVREGGTTALDVFAYGPETDPLFVRRVLVHERNGQPEVLLITEDKNTRSGAFTRIPIEGDRFGTPELIFDGGVLGGLAREDEDNFVVIGNEGLVGLYEVETGTLSYHQPFFPVDLEGLDQIGAPYQYVIADGAGKLYTGDIREPDSMTRRPFALLGLRETYWYETPFGPRIYSRDHGDVLHYGDANAMNPGEIWYQGIELPPELREECPKEVGVCGETRSLSAVYRFRRLDDPSGRPPRLVTTFLSCRAAIVFEPGTDCAYGLVPPGGTNQQVQAVVPRGEDHLVLLSSGELYEVRLP